MEEIEEALNIRIKRSPALPHSQESALQFHLTGNLEPLGGRSMMTIGPGLPRMAHKLLGALFDGRDSTLECQSVVIDTLPGVLYDDVLQVIDVLLAAGYTDIRFTGRRDR